MGLPECHTDQGDKETTLENEGTIHDNGSTPKRTVLLLEHGGAAHYENLKSEDWCIPQDMEGLEYLLVDPACDVSEKGTREKNDGNENLSLDDNENIEADSEAESFVEEDWNDPEQGEVPK